MNSINKEKKRDIFKYIIQITKFKGSLEEYERWKGYKCTILGPSYTIPENLRDVDVRDGAMKENGIEAIVNFSSIAGNYVGLPVKKKN